MWLVRCTLKTIRPAWRSQSEDVCRARKTATNAIGPWHSTNSARWTQNTSKYAVSTRREVAQVGGYGGDQSEAFGGSRFAVYVQCSLVRYNVLKVFGVIFKS